jgi:transposase
MKKLQTNFPKKEDARQWILLPGNTGPYLGPDEAHLFHLELCTILICKAVKGRKGTLIAMTEGR